MIASYSQMTIETYIELVGIIGVNNPGFDTNLAIYKLLSGKSHEEVMAMDLQEYKKKVEEFNWIAEYPNGKVPKSFICEGVEYEVTWDLRKITAAQFIDFSVFTKDKSLINQNLHKIMAVLCVERGQKYNGEAHAKRAEKFHKSLTMDIVAPCAAFFLKLYQDSLPLIQSSLDSEIKKNLKDLEDMVLDS